MLETLSNFELDLQFCIGITRVNAYNIKKAFKSKEFENILNIPCACHSLNLVFNQVFKKTKLISDVIDKIDRIRFFLTANNENNYF